MCMVWERGEGGWISAHEEGSLARGIVEKPQTLVVSSLIEEELRGRGDTSGGSGGRDGHHAPIDQSIKVSVMMVPAVVTCLPGSTLDLFVNNKQTSGEYITNNKNM